MTAGKIARKLLEQNGMDPAACHVALLGDHMSAELRGALMELALHVRYTMLCAGGGGGEACSVLRREYGVSVARNAGAALLKTAELVLTFGDAVPCGAPDCLWLPCGSVHEAEGYGTLLRWCATALRRRSRRLWRGSRRKTRCFLCCWRWGLSRQ